MFSWRSTEYLLCHIAPNQYLGYIAPSKEALEINIDVASREKFRGVIDMQGRPGHLDHLLIRVPPGDKVFSVMEAICGSETTSRVDSSEGMRYTRFPLGNSAIILGESLSSADGSMGGFLARRLAQTGPGLHLAGIAFADLAQTQKDLLQDGFRLLQRKDRLYVHPQSASGILLRLISQPPEIALPAAGAAHLDHLAIRVRDLTTASQCWQRLTGAVPLHMGVHPVSNGSFKATRFILGKQMIELISPVSNMSSIVADRLRSHGEGVQTIALIAKNLEETVLQLKEMGIRLIEQAPHIFVHPGDAAGLLIQLTPRIEH